MVGVACLFGLAALAVAVATEAAGTQAGAVVPRAAAVPPVSQLAGPASSGAPSSEAVLLTGRNDPTHKSSAPAHRDLAPASALAGSGIPETALLAYQRAAAREAQLAPACGLSWPLLAGIGRVESDHGRFAGAVLHADGLSTPPVVGIPLDGHGTALIRDTDGGRLDGDTSYDRAVGPMQFIPSTWASWGVDANGDGRADAFNIFDAAAAAGDYVCAAGGDLTTTAGQVRALLSYNHSYDYVQLVMSVERLYATGAGVVVPVVADPRHVRHVGLPTLPPVDPGPPRAASAAPTAEQPASSTSASLASTTSKTSTSASSAPASDVASSSTTSPEPATSSVTSGDATTPPADTSTPAPDPVTSTSTDASTAATTDAASSSTTDAATAVSSQPSAGP